MDEERMARTFVSNMATLGMYNRKNSESSDFGSDLWDAFTYLNDNDLKDISDAELASVEKVIKSATFKGYDDLQRRRARMIRPLINKENKERDSDNG